MKFGALALLAACGGLDAGGAAAVADRFASLYFVEAAQETALPLASGPARAKLEEELRLVESVRRGGYTAAMARAPVAARRLSLRAEGDRARAEYAIEIGTGRDRSTRRALLLLRREPAGWQVTSFQLGAPP